MSENDRRRKKENKERKEKEEKEGKEGEGRKKNLVVHLPITFM